MRAISDLAQRLGAIEERPGISWQWYVGFSKETADEFVAALKAGGVDYRGPYCDGSVRVRVGSTI